MHMRIIYVIYGGLIMCTSACQAQLFYDSGSRTPHKVIYNSHSHVSGCMQHVPCIRVNLHRSNIRIRRYHNIRRYHRPRQHLRYQRYHKHRRHHYYRHKHRRIYRRHH